MNNELFNNFLTKYPPSNQLTKPTEELLQYYSDKLPNELLNFWKEYGFGNYGDGVIKLINPSEYSQSLYDWLGKKESNKIPIAITGFGDIFYYRKLSETVDDVCLLDIHYRNTHLCSYNFTDFFESYIIDDDVHKLFLRKDLFAEALLKFKKLESKDVFYFVPALALGGDESIQYIRRGSATVHQLFLFALGN